MSMNMNIGLQLYTVRDVIGKDVEGVIKRVADIGYKGVEFTYSPDQVDMYAEIVKKYSLEVVGAHIGLNEIENNYDTVKNFADKLGFKNIVIPWIADIDTAEKAIATAQKMEAVAQKLKADGYTLGFHNHTVEYLPKLDGKTAIDIFLEEAPSLKHEIDVGWAFAAGANVVEYIKKMGDRVIIVHIKDVDDNKTPTEIGSGNVNMQEILQAAWDAGIKWGVVEQDSCINYEPLESIKVSYDYLLTINK